MPWLQNEKHVQKFARDTGREEHKIDQINAVIYQSKSEELFELG